MEDERALSCLHEVPYDNLAALISQCERTLCRPQETTLVLLCVARATPRLHHKMTFVSAPVKGQEASE